MPIQRQQLNMRELCEILDLPQGDYDLMKQGTIEQAQQRLDNFKDLVKKQQRKLAKLYHPDLPKNGSVEEERMKMINAVVDAVDKLAVQRLEPKPQPVTVHFHTSVHTSGGWSNDSTTSSASNFGGVNFRFSR